MGSPAFAIPSLDILLANGYEVVAVVTATDKETGKKKQPLLETPVKAAAVARGIPVLQPRNLKSPAFLELLRQFRADLQVVVAFRMLPEAVWSMPPLGTINLHASLLPRYRGAAPINWAIIRGESETGLTTFFIRHEIDTGHLLFQTRLPIGAEENAGSLHDRMMVSGAELILRTVRAIESGAFEAIPQDDSQATPAPKLSHENTEIDSSADRRTVHNFIRGLSPYPGAWTTFQWPVGAFPDDNPWEGTPVKLYETRILDIPSGHLPGMFVADGKKRLLLSVADGYLDVRVLQPAGRRKMDAVSFLNGLRG